MTTPKSNEAKRLNLVMDPASFAKLQKIKDNHGDTSFTQAIKRSLALQEFIDDKKNEGLDLFLGGKGNTITKIIIATT